MKMARRLVFTARRSQYAADSAAAISFFFCDDVRSLRPDLITFPFYDSISYVISIRLEHIDEYAELK